ncbi:hypothetical protein PVAP13_5KG345100 [Panicum virgatum]|uniref:Protein EARLY FLOWERING 3 n=1 Tax=Panicum virgatum TaxID=38727 RepID=A0A8T0SQQ8_PANVG|nr:hypothetical protein PVAP13_5KG345100 [Panicum virgatum]
MTRGGAGGAGEGDASLFPRLRVSDAGRGGGPRAPPRNKMALYEQFTVPPSRFSSSARAAGGSFVPSTSAGQVYSYDWRLFQPFGAPSNEPARSSEKFKGNSINGQSNSTRRESGRMSSQTKNNDACASKSIAECTSQHRVGNVTKNSSAKKLANNDQFMVPSICSPIFSPCSTQGKAGVKDKSRPLSATNPHKNPSMPKSYAECYSAVNRHLERIDKSDMRSMSCPRAKEKEPVEGSKNVEVQEKSSSVQASKEKLKKKDAKTCQMGGNASHINSSDNPHLGNSERQPARMNGSSIEAKSTTKNTVPCKPFTDLNNSNQNSNLLERSLREAGAKRKRGHHDVEQSDHLSDDSVECIPSWEVSPDEIVGAIGPKHFWKARRAIQNQQRVFAVQVFELHKLIKVQKLIAASPHLLIEGDPVLGSALVGKKTKLPKGNLKVQAVAVANKDDIQLTLEQPELSNKNTDANPPSPSRDDGLGGNCQDHAATEETFTRNPPAMPAAPDNKQNNWCMNPPQNQWLVPVMSPSEVKQGRHPAAPQPHGRMEQQSLISCNKSHPSGIWRFHASRDSEPQASSTSSPFDRIQVQADGSGSVSVFPTATARNARPQPSSGNRDQQNIVIRVVPHNAQTASESAARIFQSIQKERQQNDL